MSDGPGTWHDSDPTKQADFQAAKAAWTAAAGPILESVAATYGGYIPYGDLRERLFNETGYRTRMVLSNWIGEVLFEIQNATKDDGRPPLSSLVVYADTGGVGPGYMNHERSAASFVDEAERQQTAAADRLRCYQHFCRELPADAAPQMTERWIARTTPRPQTAPVSVQVCPDCCMVLPSSGRCDCD